MLRAGHVRLCLVELQHMFVSATVVLSSLQYLTAFISNIHVRKVTISPQALELFRNLPIVALARIEMAGAVTHGPWRIFVLSCLLL